MIFRFKDTEPQLAPNVFIAPSATIIGNVIVEEDASIWFGAVLRGDSGLIQLGKGSNIQDGCIIHVNERFNTIIEANVTLGHGVIAEGCHIKEGALIGMNATILSGSEIGAHSLVAAGSLVREGQHIPDGVLAAGVPAKVIRPLTPVLKERLLIASSHYVDRAQAYQRDLKLIADN